jgi:hypothetical protein
LKRATARSNERVSQPQVEFSFPAVPASGLKNGSPDIQQSDALVALAIVVVGLIWMWFLLVRRG